MLTAATKGPRRVYEVPGTMPDGSLILFSIDSRGVIEGPFAAADVEEYNALRDALQALLDTRDPIDTVPAQPPLRLMRETPPPMRRIAPRRWHGSAASG